jgi:hypothetical protein
MSLNEYFANLASDTGANEFSLVLDHAASLRMEIRPISGRKASFEDTKFSSLQCDKMPSRPERSLSGGIQRQNVCAAASFSESCIEESKSRRKQINETIEVLHHKLTRRNSCDSANINFSNVGHAAPRTRRMSIDSSPLLMRTKESRWRN